MVNVTQARWHDLPQEMSLRTAANAFEIKLQADGLIADPTVCRIIILESRSAPLEASADRRHLAPAMHDTKSTKYGGAWSRLGFDEDEEPTWEDAAWQ